MGSFQEFSAALWTTDAAAAKRRPAADLPTLLVAVAVYVAFGLITWFHNALSWWLVLPLGACIVCLHGSLQHEAVHGFPFRSRFWNSVVVFPSLWLWLPFSHYREAHLRHHRNERLTSPLDDPESTYLTQEMWAAMGPVQRAWRTAMRSCAGRMLFGPPYVAARLWSETVRRLIAGDRQYIREWLIHVPAAGMVLVWAVGVCDIPLWQYVLLYAWPGTSITMLRSFLEHQARGPVGERTAIVEAGPVMGFLYLHNNLHALHHLEPAMPWHQRPRQYRERRSEILVWNGGYCIAGYREVVLRYLFRPKEPLIHPLPNG